MSNFKWVSVELKERSEIVALMLYLTLEETKFETSTAYGYTHFEVYCTEEQMGKINNFIDKNCV